MRGDCELKCLNAVKNMVFCKDGKPIQDPLTYKTYLDVSDDEFKEDRLGLVNPDRYNSYFGLVENDREEFESVLRVAQPNPDASLFPDFIFENGFIEHFQVTSSSVTKKGAMHTRKESEFRCMVANKAKKVISEWNETPSFDAVRSKSWAFTNPTHSYESLVDSFKRNWEHHMESYGKYTGSRQIGMFMIEYPENALAMFENVYQGWISGMTQGDIREPEQFNEYRLSRDKNLLQYVYQFKEAIKYVIFWNCARIEVVRTENIPYLLKLLPWNYTIMPFKQTTFVTSLYNISVPADPKQEGEIDDKT